MLVYQVEIITFQKVFLHNIMLSIQFYLFAHIHLNLTNHFFYHSVK